MKRITLLFTLLVITFLSSCSVEDQIIDNETPGPEINSDILYLGLMIHVEGWQNEVDDEEIFNAHAEAVEKMADILEEYGARGTFELSPEFIESCQKYGSNLPQELHDRGHGVGVHADKGYEASQNYNYDHFVTEIKEMRLDLQDQVDFPILHVSGICSEMDWVKAALDAGYSFTTGGVGYCAMSMPEDLRPEAYKNCLSPGDCHTALPEDLVESLQPISASSGEDWLYSEQGDLVIFLARNTVYAQAEELEENTEGGSGTFTSDGIEVINQNIETALNNLDPNDVNLLYYAWSIGDFKLHNEELLRQLLEGIQTDYVETGKVEWITFPELYLKYTS